MLPAPDDTAEAPFAPPAPVGHAPVSGSPLRVVNFRRYAGAQLLGSSGVWMLRMASDWLVMELTGSSAAVGLLVALQFFPLMVLGPLGGVLADRHDKRRIVMVAQACSAALAAGLAVLTLGGWIEVWHLYAMAVLLGLVAAVEQPARQVLVGEVVGDGLLRSAISTNNALSQVGGMIGPAVAGLLINAVGQGWAYATNAVVALAVCALFLSLRRAEMHPGPRLARGRGQVREGVRYVLSRPRLAWVMVLAGLMGAFGLNGPVVFTAFASQWGTGAAGLGLYNTAAACGALVGAVLAARLARLRARTVVLGAGLFGVTEIVAALMPVHAAFVAVLVVVGLATLFFLTAAATLVQLSAEPAVRGRVLALYSPILLGGHACGGLLQGWLAEVMGVQRGLVVTGCLALLSTAVVGLALARLERLRVTFRRHPWPLTLTHTRKHHPTAK